QAELVDVDRDLRVVDGLELLDDGRLDRLARGRVGGGGGGRGGVLLGVLAHLLHSVVTGSAAPSSAARSACQASVAHLTRVGNSRTPASTASLPSASGSGSPW